MFALGARGRSKSAEFPARAAHGAMIAGLAAGFDAAGLLFLEIVYEFRDDCFFHAKLFPDWDVKRRH